MFWPPNSSKKLVARTAPRQPATPVRAVRLNAAMPCDTAFRVIAGRHLAGLGTHQEATCEGDPDALHEMRVALTHLRAAIKFFSPMVDDAVKPRIWRELKWLNGELGAVRDLDVAIERISAVEAKRPQAVPQSASWQEKRTDAHRRLARSLRSTRFDRLIAQTYAWITSGPWSTMAGKRATRRRAASVIVYGACKLADWEKELLRKRRKLHKMTPRKRHRLRILNKRITSSIESFSDLLGDKELSKQRPALKPLRKAQRSLGKLNDEVRGRALARSLRKSGIAVPLHVLGAKDQKRLLRRAKKAYRKLAGLKLPRR
jgi:CHAD domain-containing protein